VANRAEDEAEAAPPRQPMLAVGLAAGLSSPVVEKRCGFCEFRTHDVSEFTEHMRVHHGWGTQPSGTRRRSPWAIGCLVVAGAVVVLAFGACSLFFLAYNGLPPFQVSDDTGTQFELKRAVPGAVRYTDGWTVAVEPPSPTRSTDGQAVWIIPVAFTTDDEGGTIGVGSCELVVDGDYRDPNSEPIQIARLGDVAEIHRFGARGETWKARLAVSRPAAQTRRAELRCNSMAHVQATFDLTPFLVSVP
jgi:hypothetical protein